MKYDVKKRYNPRYWTLVHAYSKLKGIKEKIFQKEKRSPTWYCLQMKRESVQIKKHLILLDQLIENFERDYPQLDT